MVVFSVMFALNPSPNEISCEYSEFLCIICAYEHVIHAQLLNNGAMSYLICILINFTYVCCCMPSTYISIYNIYYNLQT